MKLIVYTILLSFACFFVSSCSKEDFKDTDTSIQFEIDKQKIREYLKQNNIKADSTPEGLYYIIDYTNDDLPNIHPNKNSNVTVDYKGYLLNGKVFDQNVNKTFSLRGVIDGWVIGMPLLKEGESGRFFIPSKYAYGANGSNAIPPNSPIIFEVTLIKVQ